MLRVLLDVLVAGVYVVAAMCAGIFVSEFWLGVRPMVVRCCAVFVRDVWRSSPFPTRAHAVEFWGEARVLRYLCGSLSLVGGAVVVLGLGVPLRDGLIVVGVVTSVVCAALWCLTEWRLYRSRLHGGWG